MNKILIIFFVLLILSLSFSGCAAESQRVRNIKTCRQIIEDYHESHTYIGNDVYVCADMAGDVWNMVTTQKINATIAVGDPGRDITSIKDANHAWVVAEIAPGERVALETTGGFLVCTDTEYCQGNNVRYFNGWEFDSPKELKEEFERLKHPCPNGYLMGSDQVCHPACGGDRYCNGTEICIDGECVSCGEGSIFGEDFLCHPLCGETYCKGDSVCVNGECVACKDGYILGEDWKCHKPCGSNYTYCPDEGVCVEGSCVVCPEGAVLGDDMHCHELCGSTGTYCRGESICVKGECKTCPEGYVFGADLECHKLCGTTNKYCPENSVCINNQCLRSYSK